MMKLSPQILVYTAGNSAPSLEPPRLGFAQIASHAFGDGSHATTRLCAGAVDYLCRTQTLRSCLDVGTGTGILARIARARGGEFIVGTDIDPSALDVARDNAGLDDSKAKIQFEALPPNHWGPGFDLVVANILEGPLRDLAPLLAAALKPGGHLLLSGFTRLQTPSLRVIYTGLGLQVMSESNEGEWALLHLRLLM